MERNCTFTIILRKVFFHFLQVVNGDKTLGENIALDIQDELFVIQAAGLDKIKGIISRYIRKERSLVLIPDLDANYSRIFNL